jgi:phage-related protein
MSLWINDVSAEDLGFASGDASALEQWGAALDVNFRSSPVPGFSGHIVGGSPTSPPRIVPLSAVISADTIGERNALLQTLMSNLQGRLELRFSDEPDRILYGVCTKAVSSGASDAWSFALPDLRVSVEITCMDAAKYDRNVQTLAFGSARQSMPMGNMPHDGTLYIMGAATTPVITYRNMAGDSVQTMTLSTLGGDDYYAIDLLRKKITRYDATVASDALDEWTAGDFPVFDPGDCDVEAGIYPTLEVSSGSGLLVYRRRWSN